MNKNKDIIRELLPFIISAAEVAAECCNCQPEEILLATVNHFRNSKRPLSKKVANSQKLVCRYCEIFAEINTDPFCPKCGRALDRWT